MKWRDKLNEWKNNIIFNNPKNIKDRYLWNTSVLKNNGNAIYKEKFKIDKNLPKKQNYNAFNEYINNSLNKYVTCFTNLSKDTTLVIPIPRKNKNYVTIKDFIENAPLIQQKEFWKNVSKLAIKDMKKYDKVWISTHGFGVPYFHIRICSKPKYYFNNNLKKV